MHTAMY